MVLGMRYDSSFNYAMAGLYRAAVVVPALIVSLSVSAVYAADPPVPRSNVSVNLNPTTGYYSVTNSTLRLPNGVSVSPSAATPPVVSKYSGGLKQTIPTGITIDAIKKSAPLPVAVRASTPSLKNAAKGLLRGNLASLTLGVGLNALLDGIDALIDDAGNVVRAAEGDAVMPLEGGYFTAGTGELLFPSPATACDHYASISGTPPLIPVLADSYWRCENAGGGRYATVYIKAITCPQGSNFIDGVCRGESGYTPVSGSDLDGAVDSSYNPDPSDWVNLTPHLSLDDVEITSSPTLQGEPRTTTVFDAEGNPQ